MPTVNVRLGNKKCVGGHYDLIVYVDGAEAYRVVKHEDELLDAPSSCKSVGEAVSRIVDDIKAPNMSAWDAIARNKSIEIQDGIPLNVIMTESVKK